MLGTSDSHSHVSPFGFISCKGSSITSWCWSFETSQLSHFVFAGFGESETFASESCFGNNQPSRHLNQKAQCFQAGIIDVSFQHLELLEQSAGRIRRPWKNFQTFVMNKKIPQRSHISTSTTCQRLEPAHCSVTRLQ